MDSIKVVAEIEITPEDRPALVRALKTLVEGSRAESGNKAYDLTENISRTGHFFVLEEWASEKALEEHNGTPHFKAFVAAIEGKAVKLNISKVKSVF